MDRPYEHQLLPSNEDDVFDDLQNARGDSSDEDQCPSVFDVPMSFTTSESMSHSDGGNEDFDPNPLHFHRPSGRDESTIGHHQMICGACRQLKSAFYCSGCIRNGEFATSKSDQILKERFNEKKLRMLLLQEQLKEQFQRIASVKEKDVQRDELVARKSRLRFKIEALKREIEMHREQVKQKRSQIEEIRVKQLISKKQPNNAKIEFTRSKINECNQKINGRLEVVKEKANYIREETAVLVHQLKTSIFTIEPYVPDDHDASLHQHETLPLLYYDSGSSGSGYETNEPKDRYTIIEPWISITDDFAAFHQWVAYHSGDNTVPSTSLDHGLRNTGYRTTAALGYITQLISVLANLFDVHLPKRLHFSDFYSKTGQHGNDIFLSENELTHKIAKLNTNMVYLCLSQNVDFNHLHIRQYLRNLLLLINTSSGDLGRRGHVFIDPDMLECIDSNLSDQLALIDEPIQVDFDPIGIDDFGEWESIPPGTYPSETSSLDNQLSTANFMSSTASALGGIFRTVTGQH